MKQHNLLGNRLGLKVSISSALLSHVVLASVSHHAGGTRRAQRVEKRKGEEECPSAGFLLSPVVLSVCGDRFLSPFCPYRISTSSFMSISCPCAS